MAISVYSERRDKISKVVFICGKLNRLDNIQQKYFNKNPAYKKCVEHAKRSMPKLSNDDKKKMTSVYPIFDEVVTTKDARLAGTKQKKVLSFFHALSIFLAISLYKKSIIKLIKKENE